MQYEAVHSLAKDTLAKTRFTDSLPWY